MASKKLIPTKAAPYNSMAGKGFQKPPVQPKDGPRKAGKTATGASKASGTMALTPKRASKSATKAAK